MRDMRGMREWNECMWGGVVGNTSIGEINSKGILLRLMDDIKLLCLDAHGPAHSTTKEDEKTIITKSIRIQTYVKPSLMPSQPTSPCCSSLHEQQPQMSRHVNSIRISD